MVLNLLELRHFKCFELLKLPLSNLTILSGTNASGKSSVLQALMLLHQTMRDHEWSDRLILNGDVAQVGMVSDIVDQFSSRDRFEVGLSNGEVRCKWTFVGQRRDMSAGLVQISIGGETIVPPARMRWLLPIDEVEEARTLALGIRDLTYITAERDGPREVYPLIDEHAVRAVGFQRRVRRQCSVSRRRRSYQSRARADWGGPDLVAAGRGPTRYVLPRMQVGGAADRGSDRRDSWNPSL